MCYFHSNLIIFLPLKIALSDQNRLIVLRRCVDDVIYDVHNCEVKCRGILPFFCFGFWIAKQNDYVRSYIHNGKLIFCRLYVVINMPKKVEHMDNDLVTGLQSKVWQEIKNRIHLLKKAHLYISLSYLILRIAK